jgi:hypothetical protein
LALTTQKTRSSVIGTPKFAGGCRPARTGRYTYALSASNPNTELESTGRRLRKRRATLHTTHSSAGNRKNAITW